jgi:(1->4)-alpha-D-glucan 1-alpha-D-glucosylmutase
VNSLQHDAAGCEPLTAFWSQISGRTGEFGAEEELARRQILEGSFSAQREALVSVINRITQADVGTRDFSRSAIRRCVTEILVHFPVYRIYACVNQASLSDSEFMHRAVAAARSACLPNDRILLETLGRWLSGERIRSEAEDLQSVALARFQQLSAPLCAKAVEDTAFYRYGRLISRNDVGFDVRQFASSPARFHERMKFRFEHFPRSMLATATHDHKRGEDMRARLAVLSELPREWEENVSLWLRQTLHYRAEKGGTWMPSDGDIAILLQTIVGAWPMALRPCEKAELALYAKRIAAWQQKALREAKLYSDWGMPDEPYEGAANDFIAKLFSSPSDVLDAIARFAHRCMAAGAVNGLTQLLLKLTVPGTPDIYQGTEFWDLSLVDPDNRAPIDFALRQKKLRDEALDDLLFHWRDGQIKQYIMRKTLAARQSRGDLFNAGSYLPLKTVGSLSDRLVAFARIRNESCAIIVVSRLVGGLMLVDDSLILPEATWGDTGVIVPAELRKVFSDVFTKQKVELRDSVCAAQILGRLPIAFLANWVD